MQRQVRPDVTLLFYPFAPLLHVYRLSTRKFSRSQHDAVIFHTPVKLVAIRKMDKP
jgi:hypothetical protein